MNVMIELNLFSGRPNATCRIGAKDARELLAVIEGQPIQPPGFQPNPASPEPLGRPRSGYRGWIVTVENDATPRRLEVFKNLVLDGGACRACSGPAIERDLYSLLPKETVREFLGGMSYDDVIKPGAPATIRNLAAVSARVRCPNAPPFDGAAGDFETFRYFNNCYNYATNVVNRVPLRAAIPGSPNVRLPLTMSKLRNALVDDGLEPLGMSLDGACPEEGSHFIAVLLRRNPTGAVRDFHCLRLDKTGTWSHKDGNGEVLNIDDDGAPIVDLARANLSWDPELAGFYRFSNSNRHNIS